MRAELTLDPVPTAARTARRWVKRTLADGDHDPVIDAVVLGVSELVTNALLHVRGSILVRITDDGLGPLRVEVHDDSSRPPSGHPAFVPDGLHTPSTIGRGLQIVDSISHSWGVSYEETGKCVWFTPAVMPQQRRPGAAHAFEWAADPEVADLDERVPVRLLDLPVLLFLHYRERFFDLEREMTLIALDSGRGSIVARRLIDAARRLQDFHVEASGVTQQILAARERGLDRADITVEALRELGPIAADLRTLLDKANDY